MVTLLPVTAIWEDLTARADLGSEVACAALSDLSYIRDRTIHQTTRRSARPGHKHKTPKVKTRALAPKSA